MSDNYGSRVGNRPPDWRSLSHDLGLPLAGRKSAQFIASGEQEKLHWSNACIVASAANFLPLKVDFKNRVFSCSPPLF